MYSGTTIRTRSGRIMGAHQKIDRVARRQLTLLLRDDQYFPSIRDILHFEGKNGPDGIKAKSPGYDEPWHFIDPLQMDQAPIFDDIDGHVHNLSHALAAVDETRAAFEAAWLAHAIVDALTPAHHYPLADKIEELWGKPHADRSSLRDKILAGTRGTRLASNWQYWGAKGVFTTHFMFEFGVASTISPLRFTGLLPSANELVVVDKRGIRPLLETAITQVYHMRMYEMFYKNGWTRHLARQTRTELTPRIITMVMVAWYHASLQAARAGRR